MPDPTKELSRESVEAALEEAQRLLNNDAPHMAAEQIEIALGRLTALQARLSEVTGERDAIIEECAKVAETCRVFYAGDGDFNACSDQIAQARLDIATAIRKGQSQ